MRITELNASACEARDVAEQRADEPRDERMADASTRSRQLMWHGVLLFLLGLLTGLVETRFTNIRMGLAAHLEGVMNGTLLIALGAIWGQVKLPPTAKVAAFATALYGAYANWATTTFAAIFGTAAANPTVSAGYHGQPWQEEIASLGFLSVAIAIIAASLLILWGLRRRALR